MRYGQGACQVFPWSRGGLIPSTYWAGGNLTGAVIDETHEFRPTKKPDLEKVSGAFRMFRVWKMSDDGKLTACVADFTWSKGENASLTNGGDASPNSGFYGFNTLEELQAQEAHWWEASQSGKGIVNVDTFSFLWNRPEVPAKPTHYICGTTLNYGHLKLSEKGARSQYAVPEYIIEPDGSDPDFGLRVLNVAENYDMKIITLSQARSLKTGRIDWWKGRPNR